MARPNGKKPLFILKSIAIVNKYEHLAFTHNDDELLCKIEDLVLTDWGGRSPGIPGHKTPVPYTQCEKMVRGTGCTIKGVCRKEDEIAAYPDVLVYLCKGISVRNLAVMEKDQENPATGIFIAETLFSTLTNTTFDKQRFCRRDRPGCCVQRRTSCSR